ncbi:TRAP transporter small permease [Roseomonas alkaliterrae]|uniref:TRAP transporter small permease protein n=1 Tax=Neoroseomonas alkaliterrae TaxID=1452450 RepID=A0A840Y0A1_9PROT|nr:TRAP transporter small permease [Neoroseomonas alkaliterrae]MBB5689451.1 TRAP-type C4-dicarboxylate transport system permease small subunit [Neoroseomonas alkaliterrae]MBR0677481.1 TRAP transporter small permease [Neoroseomonas alkaliterrae]
MNLLPLQVTGAATLATVGLALWAGSGDGARAAIRRAVLVLDRYATGVATLVASFALILAVAAGAWQVVARFATNTPSIWSEALVRTALIWMAFIGVAVALRAGALVSIDVAHRYTSGALRRALEAASLAAVLSMLGVMFWFGWMMAERVKFQEMAGLEVSMSWGYAAIPVGAVFAMIGAVAHFLDRRVSELENAT